jgi:hypothetical protein
LKAKFSDVKIGSGSVKGYIRKIEIEQFEEKINNWLQ